MISGLTYFICALLGYCFSSTIRMEKATRALRKDVDMLISDSSCAEWRRLKELANKHDQMDSRGRR